MLKFEDVEIGKPYMRNEDTPIFIFLRLKNGLWFHFIVSRMSQVWAPVLFDYVSKETWDEIRNDHHMYVFSSLRPATIHSRYLRDTIQALFEVYDDRI